MLFSSHNSALCCLETDLKNERTLFLVCFFQAVYERERPSTEAEILISDF